MRRIDIAEALARFPVFEAVSPETRRRLAAGGAPFELPRSAHLFRRGDPSDGLYVLLSGAAEVTLTDAEGRVSVLARLGSGDMVGEMGAVSGLPRSTDVCVVSRAEFWRIGSAAVRSVLEEERGAAMALIGLLVERLRETDELVQRAQWQNLGARLARLLLDGRATTTLSQGDLARQIGASREAVNRRIAAWRRAGWVTTDAKGLHILAPARLAALCGH